MPITTEPSPPAQHTTTRNANPCRWLTYSRPKPPKAVYYLQQTVATVQNRYIVQGSTERRPTPAPVPHLPHFDLEPPGCNSNCPSAFSFAAVTPRSLRRASGHARPVDSLPTTTTTPALRRSLIGRGSHAFDKSKSQNGPSRPLLRAFDNYQVIHDAQRTSQRALRAELHSWPLSRSSPCTAALTKSLPPVPAACDSHRLWTMCDTRRTKTCSKRAATPPVALHAHLLPLPFSFVT
ncbi:hypothetical protein BDV93DRAFT_551049 [Ceratobasidium sp. AG-I]|nr:hypothetical protein BDV93DRAFT_551049 [Ceratobasidium sp. AG-I]